MYNFTCMCIFMANHLVLDNKFDWFFLKIKCFSSSQHSLRACSTLCRVEDFCSHHHPFFFSMSLLLSLFISYLGKHSGERLWVYLLALLENRISQQSHWSFGSWRSFCLASHCTENIFGFLLRSLWHTL